MVTGNRQKELNALRRLARDCGVQTSYVAMGGKRRQASAAALRAVLGALEIPLDRVEDAGALLAERRLEAWGRLVEPVTVVWGSRPGVVAFYAPLDAPEAPVTIELQIAGGAVHRATFQPQALATLRRVKLAHGETMATGEPPAGREGLVKALPLPRLAWGYHTLRVEAAGRAGETMIIAAPLRAYEPPEGESLWGGFMPLYALSSAGSWGAGDLGDFTRLVEWVQSLGGSVAATLPLLAAFLDEPFDPSPYVPASRLFWNEFYIDMARVPELETSPAARALADSAEARHARRKLREAHDVDYRGVMELKRAVLRQLALEFFGDPGRSPARQEAYRNFVRANPKVEDYAAFRAAGQRQRSGWPVWPEPLRSGTIQPQDYDEDIRQYHLYVQFIVQEQLDAVAEQARRGGPGLYLDLPLGVHPDSYDVWRERDSFAWGVSGGAPPDAFFSKGQNWGFAPLHPLKLRQSRYGYIIECLRRLMSQAGVVRIDHVMGLHRLFWVPQGMEATEGVYVQYPAEELHAILNVESHRHRSMIVGEDLGTVPGSVRRAMGRHNIHGMYVLQFSLRPESATRVAPVPEGTVASLNTHDTPSFAGYWQGRDLDDQVDLGLVRPAEEAAARQWRAEGLRALVRFLEDHGHLKMESGAAAASLPGTDLLRATLEFLGRAPARIVLVNLEDLWRELQQQNVPGTCEERPNWRQKARYSLEEFAARPEVRELLEALDRARREARKKT